MLNQSKKELKKNKPLENRNTLKVKTLKIF